MNTQQAIEFYKCFYPTLAIFGLIVLGWIYGEARKGKRGQGFAVLAALFAIPLVAIIVAWLLNTVQG